MVHEKENLVFNNKFPFLLLFSFVAILYLGIRVDYWFFLLLVLIPCTIKKVKINKWQLIISFSIIFIFAILLIWAYNFSFFEVLNKHISTHIRNVFVWFFEKTYSDETSSFIRLILFNIKSKETYIFLKQTVDLGIVWLISSGAFHLSLIARCVNRLFRKRKLISFIINISLISLYTLILGFGYGCMRVLLRNILKKPFNEQKISRLDQLSFIGICICLFNPSCFKSYRFVMSFLVCITSYFVISWNLENRLLTTVVINLFAFVVMIPFVIETNHKISILTFINTLIFSYFFMFVFLYFVLFSWLPFMSIIHIWIIRCCYVLIGNISFSNIYIWSSQWPKWAFVVYYLGGFVIGQIIYLIVKNNKI